MKNLLILITIMLVGGCGKGKEAQTKTKVTEPVKELTLEEKVVGTYEIKEGEVTIKHVHLENGVFEWYENGKKREAVKWSISKDGEIHVEYKYKYGHIAVFRINKDGNLTWIASIVEGKRTDIPKEEQPTYIKIK